MSIKFRLIVMNFMQYFIWGSWLLTIGVYWFQNKHWSGEHFGAIFSTMGISAIFMPALTGIIADRFVNAEKLYGLMHILGAITLFCIPLVNNPFTFFWVMLLNMVFYMPTLSLSITVAFSALKNSDTDIVKDYPPIRIWGTIGFIAALWTVSLTHNETSANQFYIASAMALTLGIYSFTLPKAPPLLAKVANKSFVESLGLKAFTLFKVPKFTIFFAFSLLLGAALQLTNAYGDTYIHDFANVSAYKDTIAVKYPAIIMSISQISETLFILAIPFFLRRFGIKYVMLFSMLAWVLRFGLFAFGDPASGLWMIIGSCIVYGMAFDFFNISGSLFVETQASPEIRASAQGLFMMMVNGFGAFFGSIGSGFIIDKFFTHADHSKNWHGIWLTFAAYALVIAVIFPFIFRYKHNAALKHAIAHA
ncbi:nucleoside permease [Mucilaginibacter lappiensis]|uniref:NHS family xanthosine MFS transporter n=1 Tax=Mucilaginibacter lappiensis TaxID=354630 RepID=A0A1N6X3Z7_9SPHI|nr:nucleoside permease [Mucilaginibacter lappiensis]MBB6109400.1 NHS family xanthosine MFS transporter [Mucilaginibacter lappiensis]MBB6127637.1 NHS family xanthosine MFS transporter [Mucilaginibacter lappiensis]SIQ97025.1 MFS transporter, NHS family, xanthosine permease [Mucilaginibacter lappiensis]